MEQEVSGALEAMLSLLPWILSLCTVIGVVAIFTRMLGRGGGEEEEEEVVDELKMDEATEREIAKIRGLQQKGLRR